VDELGSCAIGGCQRSLETFFHAHDLQNVKRGIKERAKRQE
jgi:hypothetical protein